jgi:hypothetical protein
VEGDSIKILRRRLAEMPSDLEQFFKALLARLDKIYEPETSQVLKLASLPLNRRITGMDSWLDFWLLKELDFSEIDFAVTMKTRVCEIAQIEQMKDDTIAFINASCRDFLSVSASGRMVDYLHRTVHDFLSTAAIQALLDAQVPSTFQNPQFLLHVRLARCKILTRSYLRSSTMHCFGASEPPDTINSENYENYAGYVFPGSDDLADAFATAMSALLHACESFELHVVRCPTTRLDGTNQMDHVIVLNQCRTVQDCQEIYEFLVANGGYSSVLKATETHLMGDCAALIDVAERFPLCTSASSEMSTSDFVAVLDRL